jgi:hypothetical protein
MLALGLAFGQARGQWQAGVKVGFGQSGYTGSSEFNWDSGPASGGFIGYQLAPILQLQIEADPVSKVGTSNTAGSNLTLTADYLAMPIMLQVQIPTPSGVTPFVSAGSVVSLRLSCNLQFSGGGVQTNDSCEGSGRPKTNPVTFGVGAGAGLERSFGIMSVLIEGRVITGLTVETLPLDAKRPRSYGWSLLSGVSFPLGHAVSTPQVPRPMPAMGAAPAAAAAATSTRVATAPLPEIPAVAIASPRSITPVQPRDALDLVASDRLVSVHAVDADVRSLLLLIAKEGGVSIIVDPEVSGRVWVTLTNVPVVDALRAVIQSAHLTVTSASTNAAQAAIVFYQLPVNVNTAPAPAIAARYDVSDEMARWVAENQKKTPP